MQRLDRAPEAEGASNDTRNFLPTGTKVQKLDPQPPKRDQQEREPEAPKLEGEAATVQGKQTHGTEGDPPENPRGPEPDGAHKRGSEPGTDGTPPEPPGHSTAPEGIPPQAEQDEWEPDLVGDPLTEAKVELIEKCTYVFFAGLKIRQAPVPDAEQLRRAMKETLNTAPGPASEVDLADGEKAELEAWVKDVARHTYDSEKFVAGSFGRHLPAWEEMLKDSTRESSKKVLKMLRNGVKPQFVGTAEADSHKREQVRTMLARKYSPGEVEAKLNGQVPHEVEFENHRSFYDNASFAIGEVVKMVENTTLHVYGPADGKPKVVHPLGVVNLPKGRLVVNARYVNLFCKRQTFKYETLREVLTFLTERSYFTTWDFKAGYYHVLIHPAYRKYFGIKVGEVYMHYNGMCFGWSEACFIYTLLTQEAAKEIRL